MWRFLSRMRFLRTNMIVGRWEAAVWITLCGCEPRPDQRPGTVWANESKWRIRPGERPITRQGQSEQTQTPQTISQLRFTQNPCKHRLKASLAAFLLFTQRNFKTLTRCQPELRTSNIPFLTMFIWNILLCYVLWQFVWMDLTHSHTLSPKASVRVRRNCPKNPFNRGKRGRNGQSSKYWIYRHWTYEQQWKTMRVTLVCCVLQFISGQIGLGCSQLEPSLYIYQHSLHLPQRGKTCFGDETQHVVTGQKKTCGFVDGNIFRTNEPGKKVVPLPFHFNWSTAAVCSTVSNNVSIESANKHFILNTRTPRKDDKQMPPRDVIGWCAAC